MRRYSYQAPEAEELQVSFEANLLASGEGLNPKPLRVGAPDEDYEDD